jgi:hypothetical protein
MKTIENNQSTIVFRYRGDIIEEMLRNSSGKLDRFAKAMRKYPPIYVTDLVADLERTKIVGRRKSVMCRGGFEQMSFFLPNLVTSKISRSSRRRELVHGTNNTKHGLKRQKHGLMRTGAA